MLKTILNLNGAQPLSRNEQKLIHGGDIGTECTTGEQQPPGGACNWAVECCSRGYCITKEGNEFLCGL